MLIVIEFIKRKRHNLLNKPLFYKKKLCLVISPCCTEPVTNHDFNTYILNRHLNLYLSNLLSFIQIQIAMHICTSNTLTSHKEVDGSSCRVSHIVNGCAVVDAGISGSDRPESEGPTSDHGPLRERPRVPRPGDCRRGKPCRYFTWQRDILAWVHHVRLVHR